jgi:hypothetical protein
MDFGLSQSALCPLSMAAFRPKIRIVRSIIFIAPNVHFVDYIEQYSDYKKNKGALESEFARGCVEDMFLPPRAFRLPALGQPANPIHPA